MGRTWHCEDQTHDSLLRGLEGARLELGPGLNVIQAPNEGGKSTWAGFLKAMLYGIDTRDRDRKGYLADKNRYQPWSGAPMEGELVPHLARAGHHPAPGASGEQPLWGILRRLHRYRGSRCPA